MAAADYIRAASAELRKAAQDLNQQVRSVQAEHDRTRRDLESSINTDEVEIRTKEAAVVALTDPRDVTAMRLRIAALLKINSDHKKELENSRSNAEGQVNGKLAFAGQLESLASQLDGLAGRPEAG